MVFTFTKKMGFRRLLNDDLKRFFYPPTLTEKLPMKKIFR